MSLIQLTPLEQPYRQACLSMGPLAYWPLNELTGTTAVDITANPNNGTYHNSPTLGQMGAVAGGFSVKLNGTSQYVSAPAASKINLTGSFISFGGWVYPLISTNYYPILEYSNGSGNANRQYALYLFTGATNKVQLNINGVTNGSSGVSPILSSNWVVNAWNHVFVVYNGTTTVIYLNGKSAFSSTSFTGNITAVSPGSVVSIGTNDNGGIFADGYSEEMAIFSIALTAGQIQKLYNSRG
jgi:Concanavalin A-like lectin/glucanases superfamily